MPLSDELAVAQRCLDDLHRAVDRMTREVGGGLEVRRVRNDLEHLRDSLALLRETAARGRARPARPAVIVPDAPYDTALWSDADDEGIGARDRRAP